MKRILLILLLSSLISLISANELLVQTLPNGMQVAVKENRINETVGFYCFVKTGSVNEGKFLGAGISHYLEHLVSSGSTEYRTEKEYQQMSQEMGALINAYTSNVITAYHIEVEKTYQDIALQMMSEQLTSCVLDSFEVAREKQVILKEIVMRSTPEQSKMYQRLNELVYPNSNSRFPVIGYTELFKTITREDLLEYYQERYAPNNMIFVAVGDFEAEEMMTKLEETFDGFKRRQLDPPYLPVQNPRAGSLEFVEEFDIEQPMVFISTILPAHSYTDVTALNTALSILFDKRRSPINYKLVEELQLVNYVYAYANGTANEPEGSIMIGFEPKETADIKTIIEIIDSELEKYSRKGFKKKQIENEINRFKANRLLSTPSVGRAANIIGWSLLRYGVPDYYEIQLNLMESLKSEHLQDVLIKHLLPRHRVVFAAVPIGSKEILTAEERDVIKTDPEKIELNKNLTLLYRQNTEKPLIQGVIYLPVSLDYETTETAGTFSAVLEMIFSGSKKYPSLEMTEWLEDHVVRLNPRINSRGTFIDFKCLTDDYPILEDMIIDALNNPSFDSNEINLVKENYEAGLKRSRSRAYTAHSDFMSKVLYDDSKYGLSYEEEIQNVIDLTRDEIIDLHNKFFKVQNAIITLTGDLSKQEAENNARKIFKNLPGGKIEAEQSFLPVPELNQEFVNKYKFEQVNVNLNMPAPNQLSEDFKAMTVINLICNGARGRIHNALRGENDLAYYGYSSYSYSENHGYFRLTSQTSIDRKDELIGVLKSEIEKLKSIPVSSEEIALAIEENQKIMNSYMDDNQLPYYLTNYEAAGLGYDYLKKSADYLRNVTSEDIQRVANEYFQNIMIIVSEPSEDVKLIVE